MVLILYKKMVLVLVGFVVVEVDSYVCTTKFEAQGFHLKLGIVNHFQKLGHSTIVNL